MQAAVVIKTREALKLASECADVPVLQEGQAKLETPDIDLTTMPMHVTVYLVCTAWTHLAMFIYNGKPTLLQTLHHAKQPTSGSACASASVAAVRYNACGSVRWTVNHPAEVLPPRCTSCCCSSAFAPAPCAVISTATPGWPQQALKLQLHNRQYRQLKRDRDDVKTCSRSQSKVFTERCCPPLLCCCWFSCCQHLSMNRITNHSVSTTATQCWLHDPSASSMPVALASSRASI